LSVLLGPADAAPIRLLAWAARAAAAEADTTGAENGGCGKGDACITVKKKRRKEGRRERERGKGCRGEKGACPW